jgi:hypothetical protein
VVVNASGALTDEDVCAFRWWVRSRQATVVTATSTMITLSDSGVDTSGTPLSRSPLLTNGWLFSRRACKTSLTPMNAQIAARIASDVRISVHIPWPAAPRSFRAPQW